MTVFAGMISFDTIDDSFEHKCTELREQIETSSSMKASYVYKHNNAFFIGLDVGAFKYSGINQDEETITIVAGDPIITTDVGRSRTKDVEAIHDGLKKADLNILRKARGVFCGVHFNKLDSKIYLFSDKLGIRPLYYYKKSNFIVFSTVFKYLQNLPFIDKQENFQAICELVAFNYCLADRSPFQYVNLLYAGEIITFSKDNIMKKRYWRWELFKVSGDNYDNLVENAYTVFVDSIKIRLGDETNAIAFLSGGLDSRCVVASLLKQNVQNLYTFNFSTEMSQDKVFARLCSEKLNCTHREKVFEKLSFPNWSQLIADEWKSYENYVKNKPKYPQMAWSGDGGSVGIGHEYLNKQMVLSLQKDHSKAAVEEFLRYNNVAVPARILSSKYARNVNKILQESVEEETEGLQCKDKGRKLYYFLMFNDQRRHLHAHFEEIDTHKVELMLPFFDSNFIEKVISVPIDKCLYHEFYMDWFGKFPPEVREIPWQTYPGHKACPLEIPNNLTYQWDKQSSPGKEVKKHRKTDYSYVIQFMNQKKFPVRYLDKKAVFIAALLHRYNLRDYSYIVSAVGKFCKYIQ